MNPDRQHKAPAKTGAFCLTNGKEKAILPIASEVQVYHDDTPKGPCRIKIKTKIGLAVLDNRRVFLDSFKNGVE